MDNFSEVDDVDMIEFFKNGYFADGGGGDAFLFRLQSDLFQGEYLACLLVCVKLGLPRAL